MILFRSEAPSLQSGNVLSVLKKNLDIIEQAAEEDEEEEVPLRRSSSRRRTR